MTFSVTSLMANSGPSLYYSDKWVRTIKDHVLYLRNLSTTQVTQVTPDLANANLNNPVGLLNDLSIPQELHYLICIVNGWEQMENVGTITQVIIPSTATIDRLRKLLPGT